VKYLKLLRIQDQYIEFGCALAGGVLLGRKEWWVLVWTLATVAISMASFIVNELVDRQDVDRLSWNPLHASGNIVFSKRVVISLFVFLTIAGLVLALNVGLLAWGVAMWLVAVFYSAKPIRLKSLPVFDIIALLVAWWVIPFLAPIWKAGSVAEAIPLILIMLPIMWCIFFPYELADFDADKKGGLMATHIILGMKNSLLFGFIFGLIGIALYATLGISSLAPWTLVFPAMTLPILFFYTKLLKMDSPQTIHKSLLSYIRLVKPITQLSAIWILVLFLLL
jgi:4-hydroxybenzoate polyprenyltransferase